MKKFIFFILCFFFIGIYSQSLSEKDVDKKINALKELSHTNPKKTIELSIECYNSAKKIDYKKGMLSSIMIQLTKYFDVGNFKKVIELSKEAELLSNSIEDMENLSNTFRLRASAYTELGFNEESFKNFNKALEISEKIKSSDSRFYFRSLIYTGIGTYMAHINTPIDSVVFYQQRSLNEALKITSDKKNLNRKYYLISRAYMNLGMTSVAKGNPKQAEEYFTKALEICRNKNYLINIQTEVLVLNEFSWLYFDQKNYDKAIQYAKEAAVMEQQFSFPYIRRDIYEVMFKSHVEKGNKGKSSEYMEKFTKLNDSIINAEKKTINIPVKHILSEKENDNRSLMNRMMITGAGLLVLSMSGGWIYLKKRNHTLHLKYEKIIENLKKSESAQEKKISAEVLVIEKDGGTYPNEKTSGLIIKNDTLNNILLKLNKIENSQKFIRKDFTLTFLASELNTNPRYLSEIIKQHKGKSYNNYINGLRIGYITNKLYKNPTYREYKISYLAEKCGFTSREIFTVIFKKETGMTPSYFIGQLKKEDTM
ncbi:tetratricopeptide repeat protein [Chryseobacterium lathyri]|uniref:AraC-like DNA-binding protein/Tfp pilus assembly protein PilF n=1 Tax=Chryseobacterium lathyri TaxID=395933 RepID=A0ABT9SSL6_9FLAO|nr:tetratricopeptide repeat protein [Chryseobacterium lathyri]MDP9962248.1 AraC-like DNA-binding protein/Tfp pilus assembly protein PilF [Chryseobacterium lathyri]MDQ0068209.1 AraC-like DNA-binding protein/Tfp pilus assembly protein PilF [Chryseobacterium lathyri]